MVIGEHNQNWLTQAEAAGRRYAETELERQEVEQARKETGSMVVDSAEQIIARSDRLLATGEIPVQAVLEVGRANQLEPLATRERIIGLANQMQAVSFLPPGCARRGNRRANNSVPQRPRDPAGHRIADLPTIATDEQSRAARCRDGPMRSSSSELR